LTSRGEASVDAMTRRISTEEVRRRYDEMAGNWRLLGIVDWLLGINRLRRRTFSDVTGDVLDVACGTGENFPYLGQASSVTAFDLSPEMVAEARRRARQMRMKVSLSVGDVQEMPFPDNTFDTVISALSSCTFPDYVAAFKEMARVTQPGGRILLVEHDRSSVRWIARRQDRNIERVFQRSACRNNRDVGVELAETGLNVVSHRTSHLGRLNRIVVEVG
jgi:ubiquinone/menaquinone biosynthesis C-methylase UbiE